MLPRPYSSSPLDAGEAGEALVVVMLAALTVLLVPPWVLRGADLSEATHQVRVVYMPDLLGQMLNPWLLPAMGFLWVLRQGAIDLSVWGAFALGGAISAVVVAGGGHPVLAIGLTGVAGLALGIAHAAAVVKLRAPAWLATALGGLAAAGLAMLVMPETFRLEATRLARWPGVNGPLWLAGGFYAASMLGLMLLSPSPTPGQPPRKMLRAWALIGSATISALGGLCGLAKTGGVILPGLLHSTLGWVSTWSGARPAYDGPEIIGDTRVLAAAVLTGVLLMHRPGRTLLAGLFLPHTMLLATIWRYRVWDVPGLNWASAALLALMAMGTQWAFARSVRGALPSASHAPIPGRKHWPMMMWAMLAAMIGMMALASTAGELRRETEFICRATGLALWASAMIMTFAHWYGHRRRADASATG